MPLSLMQKQYSGVDAWTFVSCDAGQAGGILAVFPDTDNMGEQVRVNFIDERHSLPTYGEWYLTRTQFEAIVTPVTWQHFVESEFTR